MNYADSRSDARENSTKLLLRPREAAETLGISERNLWQLTKDREVPCMRIGKSVRYPVESLKAWIEQAAKHS